MHATCRPEPQRLPSTPAPSILASLKLALKPHAPFASMRGSELDPIVRASQLRYFAPGEVVLAPGTGRPAHCYVVRQGTVRGERPGAAAASGLWELGAGEMFPLGALLGHRGVTSVYRAAEDTFCLVFPTATFDAVIAASPVFQDFCTRRLSHLLDLSRARLQAEYAATLTEERGLATPLADLLRQAPVTARAETPLAEALTTMEHHRIGSLPVVDAAGMPVGIFTRQDVIGRIVLAQAPLDAPMREVMTTPVITLPGDATAGDAALLMARSGIRHVVVVRSDGTVAGVVSERDLFSLQRLSVRELASAIRRANDIGALVQCAADVRALSHALVAQGVAAGPLTRMISGFNDQLMQRVLDLSAPRHHLAGVSLCWLGFGSEGRGEQTIATDQDNGLIFAPLGGGESAAEIRTRLLPFARDVNEALAQCGYPLCRGGVMAMNPQWCASFDEWQATFTNWIDRGDPVSLLASSIFFDLRPLWGDTSLAQRLRADIAVRAQANPRFLKQMSDNALANRAPLNWLGELRTAEDASGVEGIDLKMHGSVPFVDAARILALARGITATGTVERLQEAAAHGGLPTDEARSYGEAFEFVQMLRLRAQHRRRAGDSAAPGNGENANRVALANLSDLDQRILKEALRQARKLQQRLEVDYPG
jgi:CBS domain-containing protein